MKEDHENSNRKCFFHLPGHIFRVFKTHAPKKPIYANNAFTFIVENEHLRKELSLKNEVESITKRLYSLSNSSNLYGNLIQSNINPNLKDLLSPFQRLKYNECIEYLKEINLPLYYSYYIIDFFTATGDKFLHLCAEDIFAKIAVFYIFNIRSSFKRGSTKPKDTLYHTLTRAFSPLFFEQLQFAGIILKNKRLRNDFEECLIHGFVGSIKNINHKLVHYNNSAEINHVLQELLTQIQKYWWAPEDLLTKFNQMRLYFENLFSKPSALLEYLIFNYIAHISNYGYNKEHLKQISSSNVISGMFKYLKKMGKNKHTIKKGWTLIDIPFDRNHCIFNMIIEIRHKLNKVLKPAKRLNLCTNAYIFKGKLVSKKISQTNIA